MKRLSSPASFSLLFFMLIASSSCKKIIDEIIKHPSQGVVGDCRIEKIVARYGNPDDLGINGQKPPAYDTAYFTYNKFGNPIRIKHSYHKYFPEDTLLRGNVYKYDSQNRLKTYLEAYERITSPGLDVAREWSVLKYSGNQITQTFYYNASAPYSGGDDYNSISEIPTNYWYTNSYTYITDELGRIVIFNPGMYEIHFSYDASGNLVGDGFTYSKNYSYLQTNKVWMLLTMNYSVNEKTAPLDWAGWWKGDDFPVAFNSRKLPIKFERFYPSVFDPYRAESLYGNSEVIYKCK